MLSFIVAMNGRLMPSYYQRRSWFEVRSTPLVLNVTTAVIVTGSSVFVESHVVSKSKEMVDLTMALFARFRVNGSVYDILKAVI